MFKDHLKILALLIPNFCLLYAYAVPVLQFLPEHREAFGAPDLYLDIRYVGFPDRKEQTKQSESIEFDGTLATDMKQNEVRGKRFKVNGVIWYTFYVEDKKFLGWLVASEHGCEPQLKYQLQKDGKIIKSGSLRAGFCF